MLDGKWKRPPPCRHPVTATTSRAMSSTRPRISAGHSTTSAYVRFLLTHRDSSLLSMTSQRPFFVAPTWRIRPTFLSLARWYLIPSGVIPIRAANPRRVSLGSSRSKARIRSRVVSWVAPLVSRVVSWAVPSNGSGSCPATAVPPCPLVGSRTSVPVGCAVYPALRMVVTKPPLATNSGSGNPASAQRRIMSTVPVPIRSIYRSRYMDSASSGLPGSDWCATRSFSTVSGGGS